MALIVNWAWDKQEVPQMEKWRIVLQLWYITYSFLCLLVLKFSMDMLNNIMEYIKP
jgi:hypothetical protein